MEFNISAKYKDGEGTIGVSSHEPDNNFYTYRMNYAKTSSGQILSYDEKIKDTTKQPNKSTFYPFITPDMKSPPAITNVVVDSFGVKNAIGYGAGGFYHPSDDNYSYIVLPLHNNKKLTTPPKVYVSSSDGVEVNVVFSTLEQRYDYFRFYSEYGLKDESKPPTIRNELFYVGKDSSGKHYGFSFSKNNSYYLAGYVQAYKDELDIISEKVYFSWNYSLYS